MEQGTAATTSSEAPCWACGSPTRRPDEPWLAHMRRCDACGLAFGTTGEPGTVHDLYRGVRYFSTYRGGAVGDEREPLREREASVRLALVREHAPAARRLLEVGAAGGHFLQRAQEAGFEVEGIEPTDNGVASARRRFGLELHQGFVEEIDLPAASFDVVCAFHVLEHIPDPLPALERMRGWLRPGAVAFFEVPNAASRQARKQGAGWRHLDLAHHVSQFTPAALGALLERGGLAVEWVHSVAYTTYRAPRSAKQLISAGVQFAHSGGLPWRPHPTRYELLQGLARAV